MITQQEKFDRLTALHIPGDPLILFNVWDVGSALAVTSSGARALATGSYSVAEAMGFADGEHTPLDLVIANASRIASAVDLPVSIDFETGYGATPEIAAASLARLLDTGIVGVNIEDGVRDEKRLVDMEAQIARLEALVLARSQQGVPAWINARTDVFLKTSAEQHESVLPEAIMRGAAYARAGASSLFVPGLADLDLVTKICKASDLPVNIMASAEGPSVKGLTDAGVARISYGGNPWLMAMKYLKTEARNVLAPR